MRHVARFLVLSLVVLSSAAWAQDRQDDRKPADDQSKRVVYIARNAPAATLATVIGEHFKDDVTVEIRAVPDTVSNALLISASPEVFDEVLEILDKLDQAPRQVTIEVLVVELESSTAGSDNVRNEGRAAPKSGDLLEGLSGPAAEVLAKARRLEASGELGVVHRVRLATLENQKAMVQVGERKPVVQGVRTSAAGITRSVRQENLGMIVLATPRIGPDDTVLAAIEFEKSRLAPRADDLIIAQAATGETVRASSTVTSICKSTVQIPRGQAVVISDVHSTGKRPGQLLLIVTASIDDNAESR